MRNDTTLGAIAARRLEVKPFTDREIAMLETFAQLASIAIERATLADELERQRRELAEALEHQTATADVLRIIASSPTDVQPVLDAIVQSAERLCEAQDVFVRLEMGDSSVLAGTQGLPGRRGTILSVAATLGLPHAAPLPAPLPVPVAQSLNWAVLKEGRTIYLPDAQAQDEYPGSRDMALELGHRSIVGVPLLQNGVVLGSLVARRTEPDAFSQRQIALLETFADQAVIAIEN
jgi:GAF domain-containing protein